MKSDFISCMINTTSPFYIDILITTIFTFYQLFLHEVIELDLILSNWYFYKPKLKSI